MRRKLRKSTLESKKNFFTFLSTIYLLLTIILSCGERRKLVDLFDILEKDGAVEVKEYEGDIFKTEDKIFSEIKDIKEKEEKDSVLIKPKWSQLGVPFPEESVFKSLWGFSSSSIYFVGAGAVAYKYNGSIFENILTDPEIEMLNGIWGSAENDIWTVGIKGKILHYSGKGWGKTAGCKDDKECKSPTPCFVGKCIEGECKFNPSGVKGCCGVPTFEANFDDNTLQGFTIEDIYEGVENKGGIQWQIFSHIDAQTGKPRYTSPPNSLYFGITTKKCSFDPNLICPNFDNGKTVGASATSPEIKIPVSEKVTLKFNIFLDVEEGSFDLIKINILENGETKSVWDKTKISPPYGKDFHPVKVDLSSYSGKEISFQIFFDSVDPILNTGEGIYIDDIKIETECGLDGKEVEYPTLFDLHGTSSNNIWAVGLYGTILHYNGKEWEKIMGGAPPLFKGLCENNNGNILFVGDGGSVFIYDGLNMSKINTPTSSNLNGCADNIIVGIDGTLLLKSNNKEISIIPSPTVRSLNDAFKTDDGTVWAVGDMGTILKIKYDVIDVFNYAGGGKNLSSIWGGSDSDLIAVGEDGSILRYKGGIWVTDESPTKKTLYDIWGIKNGSVYAVGKEGVIIKLSQGGWKEIESPTTKNLTGVFFVDENNAFAVGLLGTIISLKGGKWTAIESPTKKNLYDIWGKNKDEIYAVGDGIILKWDGQEFKIFYEPVGENLRGVFALNENLAFACGNGGVILKWNGKLWSKVEVKPIDTGEGEQIPITQILYKIFAASSEDVWAVGEKGFILKLKGNAFEFVPVENEITLKNIFGISKDKIWASGNEGIILFFDGTQWKKEESGTIATLYDIWAGKDKVFVVGDRGVVLYRNIK